MLVYDRFWNDREMALGSPLVATLHNQPSLFRFKATATEAAAHGGPLSLKTVRDGETAYRFGNRELSVRASRVLIVPPRLRYSTQVGSRGADIATFYFPGLLVAEALNSLAQCADDLLDGRTVDFERAMDFPPHRRSFCPKMSAVFAGLDQSAPSLDDIGMFALETTVRFSVEAKRATARIPAVRSSVRRELFRRACLARDAISEHPEKGLRLQELARGSSLSAFHLHRVFRAAFRETPALMQRRLRVDRAKHLLTQSSRDIGEVARLVGFESESSFSRSFRAVAGLSPRIFRRASRT